MTPRSGLGKGLDALIPTSSSLGEGVLQVPLDQIRRNPRQPRTRFEPQQLEELAASIREHGILQPLVVSPESDGTYTLIAGERRLEAARLAGLRTVPVIVRQTGDRQRLELALIENIQRSDLNPLEQAEAYRQLHEEFGLSHEEIAQRVGKSRVAVTNTLRLLVLAEAVKQALLEGAISEGHARALLALPNSEAQVAALRTVTQQNLTVRQTEELVRKLSGERPAPKSHRMQPPEIREIEERLQANLGTKVSLRHGRKGGAITLYYYSEEELNALLDKLLV
ncbi:MAG: ParB/RepB/Spo0J family partition protein [Anaerolineales bacterium]